MTDFKEGDHVQITEVTTGVVTKVFYDGSMTVEEPSGAVYATDIPGTDPNVTVEKIKPPVTIFKAGDLVRSLAPFNEFQYVLARTGYFDVKNGCFISMSAYQVSEEFTSEKYELVMTL